MEFWFFAGDVLGGTNCNWTFFGHALRGSHRLRLCKRRSYLSRRELWMTPSDPPRQWCIGVFRMLVPSCGARGVLRVLRFSLHLNPGGFDFVHGDGCSLHGLRPPMGANVVLGGDRYH